MTLWLTACTGSPSGPVSGQPGAFAADGRPVARAGERLVLDVARYQHRIDWRAVKGDGIAGAYVKASEGGDLVDPRFADNWVGLNKAGLERGAYHFFTLCRHGAEQAANFLAAAPPTPDALAPALDLEFAGNRALRPARADLLAELRAFLGPVEKAWGRPVVLYTIDNLDGQYGVRAAFGRPAWVRSLGVRPGGRWRLWQASNRATVAGIDGRVDLNVLRAR